MRIHPLDMPFHHLLKAVLLDFGTFEDLGIEPGFIIMNEEFADKLNAFQGTETMRRLVQNEFSDEEKEWAKGYQELPVVVIQTPFFTGFCYTIVPQTENVRINELGTDNTGSETTY